MGLLDEILGGMVQGGLGQSMGRQQPQPQPGSGGMPGMGGGASGILMALLPVVLAMLSGRQGSGGQGAGMGGMGDLGGLLGSVLGGGGGAGGMGGLGGLLEQFQRMGYGDQANSWVGTGQNLPISPEVMAQIFGRDGLSQIAAQAGLSEAETSAGLSELLPGVVDKLTPQGQVPDLDVLAQSVADLQRRLG